MQKIGSLDKLALFLAIQTLLFAAGCSRDDRALQETRKVTVAGAPSLEIAASDYSATLPREGGVTSYVGSKSCRPCHEDEFASWHRSYHRTMTQVAAADTVKAKFHNVTLTNDGTRFSLSQKGDEFWVRMERLAAGIAEAAPGESLDVRIGLITGSHHMQVFWVQGDVPNTQIGFPFTWLIPEARWVPRNSTFVRPPNLVHRSEIWNIVCSRCHATGIEPRVDNVKRTVDTRAAELGISCEACHGPGQRHTEARLADQSKGVTADPKLVRGEIIHPKEIDPLRASQICGFCHSMKWIDRAETWREHGFRFRPDDDLEQTTPIIRPSRVADVPGLADYLKRNPDLLGDFFWPDGMIRVSGREYNGLIESPCYKSKQFSCLSCHSMHQSEPDDQLARNRAGNSACTQCHEPYRDEARWLAHTRHRAGSSGSECYNCHNPHTTYGVLKAIRSHQVSSPRVTDQLATGRPNACNLCHLDKPLAWTANYLSQWFGQLTPQLSEDQTQVADSVRLALAGDAGQRALMAWHLSWEPAVAAASGKSWVPLILAELLDDPYAAVRCVAERSLRRIGDYVPSDYDYTVSPLSRAPVQAPIVQRWSKETVSSLDRSSFEQTLVRRDDMAAMQENLARIARQRDERPVRLRE